MSEPIIGTGRETSGVPVQWGTPQDHAACNAVTRLGLIAALREVYPQWSVGDLAELADSILARLPAGGPPVSGTWRTGRRVGRTIYAQQGDAPSDSDPLIGVMDSPELAAEAVAAVNERRAGRLSLAADLDRNADETSAEADAHAARGDDDAGIMAAGASGAWRAAADMARLRVRGGQSGHSGPFPVSQGAPDGSEAQSRAEAYMQGVAAERQRLIELAERKRAVCCRACDGAVCDYDDELRPFADVIRAEP